MIITKTEMIRLLRDYKKERESLKKMMDALGDDVDMAYYPAVNPGGDVQVSTQYDQGKAIDTLFQRCSEADYIKRDTLITIKRQSDDLDRLMLCLAKLPGEERDVLMSTLMEGMTYEDYSFERGISVRQVGNIRRRAVDNLYDRVTKRRVEGTTKEPEDTNNAI